MAFQGFGKNSGPSAPPRAQTPFGHFPRPPSPTPNLSSSTFQPPSRFIESAPEWVGGKKSIQNDFSAHVHQRPSVVVPFAAPHDSGASLPDKSRQVQDLKRSRSPPSLSVDDDSLRNPRNFRGSVASSPTQQDSLLGPPYAGTNDAWNNFPSKHANFQIPKRTRSPPLPTSGASQETSLFVRNNSKRPSVSPPRLDSQSNVSIFTLAAQRHQQSPPSLYINDIEDVAAKATNSPLPKKTRPPTLPSSDQVFEENYAVQDDSERELQAKAKRLVRFKDELSQPVQSSQTVGNEKAIGKRYNQFASDGRKLSSEASVDSTGLSSGGIVLSDYEGLESSTVIIGMCPDMCPESERAERERKGDLDQYERVDGDRNQTSKLLAVKKYNRTAERETELIRPMPILKNTIDYLLNLLGQAYDETFLGLYNFLWDRMRAIRMDLRMQHIFNLDAITMLEQMIRFHIIAMHELCEYTKGEGFSEGFDAHLNIEQMNKTSVELFQLYDDHRRKGIDVPTEKEFRGYYALLKLDKHPGYKVEPAELSLDLAKMTREIRQTPEVLFARNVARACRTGNFIAFFRLARKATYLQACLMHAHFAKLQTQALASIHCGLQNNQGIPVSLVSKWLGMEEEDIGDLLEYHGFLIKEFEEPYMVKDGPFLNVENDYPVKCSKLVHLKKSMRIVDDVLSSHTDSLSFKEVKEIQFNELCQQELIPAQFFDTESSAHAFDEESLDYKVALSPKENMPLRPMLKELVVNTQNADDNQVSSARPFQWDSPSHVSSKSEQAKFRSTEKPNYDSLVTISLESQAHSNANATSVPVMPQRLEQELLTVPQIDYPENVVSQSVIIEELKDANSMDFQEEIDTDTVVTSDYDKEVAEAKLKLILRTWRRHSAKKRELREQKKLAARAALSSLSLGPPIWKYRDLPSTFGELNIDHILSARYAKHESSRSKLNVSEVIAAKLSERNPDARCLCSKIILYSQDPNGDTARWTSGYLAARTWLFSKLIPAKDDSDDDLSISSPHLSIWKKWIPRHSGEGLTCCLSIIKDAKFDNLNGTSGGASGVMFLVSECIPWKLQKFRLHNYLTSLPSASGIPLLILIATNRDNSYLSDIVKELGLQDLDKSRISTFSVVSLVKNHQIEDSDGFFNDEQLREGLQWLASECPLQPALCRVKTRDLVISHLVCSKEAFYDMDACQVGPDYCISAFNGSLDQSAGEIIAAANSNSCCWPFPEIALLSQSSEEQRAVSGHLPTIGWSLSERIKPLLSLLTRCKLPAFPDDLSWLYRGSDTGDDIKNKRIQFEHCLIRYLTELSKLMGPSMAAKEASVMLQKCTYFRLHGSTYYIVPNWVMIFRRIFNWRLAHLSIGDLSSAYVLEEHVAASSASESPWKLGLEGTISFPYYIVRPSLDEMVEIGCSPVAFTARQSRDEAFQCDPVRHLDRRFQMAINDSHQVRHARHLEQDGDLAIRSDDNVNNVANKDSGGLELVVASNASNEADRLTKLLEQCNIVQNMIDKKLSLYF